MTTARPILFSAPMVRALLAGRKTQTRRLANFEPLDGVNLSFRGLAVDQLTPGKWALVSRGAGGCWNERSKVWKCPYGVPGDLLWVRETFAQVTNFPPSVRYYATDDVHELRRKRPAIHMPRWASRLTLEIENVRVERLQDISKADVIAEGISEREGCPIEDVHCGWHEPYAALWNSINGAGSWEANPWVVVLTFKVHHANVDAVLASITASPASGGRLAERVSPEAT